MESLARLDVCINNAGVNRPKLIEDVDDATLDLMLDLNVRATFRTSKVAVKLMKKNKEGGDNKRYVPNGTCWFANPNSLLSHKACG